MHRAGTARPPRCARVTTLVEDEDTRAARLLEAQDKAGGLFAAIEPRGIIAPGVREVEASNAIRDLAADMFDPA